VIGHCQYHIIWVPKYRFRILKGPVAEEVYNCIQVFYAQLKCEIIELNVQPDHIHLLLFVQPKVAISVLMGTLKGRTAIRIFKKFPYLKSKPYWGNHFRAKRYCIDTVGIDVEMICKYVKYQEAVERKDVYSLIRGGIRQSHGHGFRPQITQFADADRDNGKDPPSIAHITLLYNNSPRDTMSRSYI
jgi:putative transposase